MDLNQAKEQIAKKEGYPGWNSLISALADDTVSASSDSFYQAAVDLVLSSKDKEIAELKVHNEQMVNDCNLYRRKSNDYYCQNDKLQSELSQLKEECVSFQDEIFSILNDPDYPNREVARLKEENENQDIGIRQLMKYKEELLKEIQSLQEASKITSTDVEINEVLQDFQSQVHRGIEQVFLPDYQAKILLNHIQSLQEEIRTLNGIVKFYKQLEEGGQIEIESLREEMKKKDKEIISLKFQYDHKPRKKSSPFCDTCGRLDCSCMNLRKH